MSDIKKNIIKYLLSLALVITVFGIYQPSFFTQKAYAIDYTQGLNCNNEAWYAKPGCVGYNAMTFPFRVAANVGVKVINSVTGQKADPKGTPSNGATPDYTPPTAGSQGQINGNNSNPANSAQAACGTHSTWEKYASVCTDLGPFYNIGSYLGAVIDSYVTPLAVIASLVVITFAGFQYIYSGGSPESIKLSKELIVGAILGLVLVFMSGFIIDKLISSDELNININDAANSWVQPDQRPSPNDLFS